MDSTNVRDLLTSFSPSSGFFAISSVDGRIKVWDTARGQVQIQSEDIAFTNGTDLDKVFRIGDHSFTCMKWLPLEEKNKRQDEALEGLLLVLGTVNGAIIALDVFGSQLKWILNACHPGGVNAISFSSQTSQIYSVGVDGNICQTDPVTGSLMQKFNVSSTAISSMAISADGSLLATADAKLNILNCSDFEILQTYSVDLGAVRCMLFSEDGRFLIFSSSDRNGIIVWKIDGNNQNQCARLLPMKHPARFLDSKCREIEGTSDTGVYIAATSEVGTCYFWYGCNMEDLRNRKPSVISLEAHLPMYEKTAQPLIFAAVLEATKISGCGSLLISYGSAMTPSFKKVFVECGTDIKLKFSEDGFVLPIDQSNKRHDGQIICTEVILELSHAYHHKVYKILFGDVLLTTTVTNMSSVVNKWVLMNRDGGVNLVSFDVIMLENSKCNPAVIQVCIGRNCLLFEVCSADNVPFGLENLLCNGEKKIFGFDIFKLQREVKQSCEGVQTFGSLFSFHPIDLMTLAKKKGFSKKELRGRVRMVEDVLGLQLKRPVAKVLGKPFSDCEVYLASVDIYCTFMCAKLLMEPP